MKKTFPFKNNSKGQSLKQSPRPSKNHGLYLYGVHPCLAALQNTNRHIKRIIATEKIYQHTILPSLKENHRQSIPVQLIDPRDFEKYVSQDAVHQNIVLEVDPLPTPAIEDICQSKPGHLRIVILDQISDPHNMGAIMRSCAAFNIDAILATEHGSSAITATLAKAASGALEWVPIIPVINLAQTMEKMKVRDFWFMGLDEDGISLPDCNPSIFQGNLGIILGAEGQGMRRLTKEKCDYIVKLPTSSTFSTLNVSNAAAIILYETWKQSQGVPHA